jgi:hypothetical protein
MGLSVTVTTAHQVSADGVTGWQWLQYAAEMAAVASGTSGLSPSGPAGLNGSPRIALRTPGLEPGSVSAARKFTALTLERWGVSERCGDVAVVVSELLSNALRHGLPSLPPEDQPIRLGLVHAGPCVMCAVADPSDKLPVPREPAWLDESGRGLHVIASLSDQWGSCMARGRPGKVVWATFIQLPVRPAAAASGPARTGRLRRWPRRPRSAPALAARSSSSAGAAAARSAPPAPAGR